MLKKQTKITKRKSISQTETGLEESLKIVSSEPLTQEENKMGLGKKHTCYSCSVKFYDLGIPNKPCPKCGAIQTEKPSSKIKAKAIRSEFDIDSEEIPIIADVEDDMILEQEDDLGIEDDSILEEEDN